MHISQTRQALGAPLRVAGRAMPGLPILLPRFRSWAGVELRNAEVSVSTSLKDFLSQCLISVWLTRLLVCQLRVPALPTVGSSQGCDRGVGSEVGISAAAGPFVPGLEWEGEENVLIFSQPWKPHPLAVGVWGLYVCLSACVRVTVSVCASCCCPASLCTFKSSGWGGGVGIVRRRWGGAGISLVPSSSF